MHKWAEKLAWQGKHECNKIPVKTHKATECPLTEKEWSHFTLTHPSPKALHAILTLSFGSATKLLVGKVTSNLMNRLPFSNGFLYFGIPSSRTVLTMPVTHTMHIQGWEKHTYTHKRFCDNLIVLPLSSSTVDATIMWHCINWQNELRASTESASAINWMLSASSDCSWYPAAQQSPHCYHSNQNLVVKKRAINVYSISVTVLRVVASWTGPPIVCLRQQCYYWLESVQSELLTVYIKTFTPKLIKPLACECLFVCMCAFKWFRQI